MLKQTFDVAIRFSPALKRGLINRLYGIMSGLDRDVDMTFMNYGYAAPDGPALRSEDEVNRHCIQLYHHLAGAVDLRGKDVLEVGSGRGGGASYVTRYLGPRSYVGVDRCEKAIEFCRRHYADVAGLTFRHGDAEALPFPDASFDVVLNVESSHGYGSVPRFLGEVARVLRPGGVFLYTDHRARWEIDDWREQLRATGLMLLDETDITGNVVEALDQTNDRKQALIAAKCPAWFRPSFNEFAAVHGSKAYERFQTRRNRYLSFRLGKDGAAA
jgi:ubiquinone/menaquinone biosynthesis C-methylase UbiE